MRIIPTLVLMLISWLSYAEQSHTQIINIAVGPDHHLMLNNDYKFYTASWHFLADALNDKQAIIAAHPMPWARAKSKVLNGKLDGLFLAANFKGRKQWAELSEPLGYDHFGHFTKISSKLDKEIIGIVRVGKHDNVHDDLSGVEYVEVATAQLGLTLLAQDKISKFTMSEGYGNYLLANELNKYRSTLLFNENNAEKRSSHMAVSIQHKEKHRILSLINEAIKSGVKQGKYDYYMNKYKVPCAHRLNC